MPHMTTAQAEAEVLKLLQSIRKDKRQQKVRWMVAYKYAEEDRETQSVKDRAWTFYVGSRLKAIKRMTDEQLAEFICNGLLMLDEDGEDNTDIFLSFKLMWKEWLDGILKDEAEEANKRG